MLSRRNARIKVMQTLYAHNQDTEQHEEKLKKILHRSLFESYELFIYSLLQLVEIADYSKIDTSIKQSKYLPTEEDLRANEKLAHNSVIEFLKNNEEFNKLVKNFKLQHYLDQELVKSLFQELSNTAEYKKYIASDTTDAKSEKEILDHLYKNILLQNEEFDQHLEETFHAWQDDYDIIAFSILATIDEIAKEKTFKKSTEFLEKLDEAEAFAIELLEKTLNHSEEYTEAIAPKLKNWEVDRIAIMDMILMKMALTEILDFPSIPLKVTMNEYIDISKSYSTPKSKEFINGVLDKLMKEMQEEGKIYKSGRGLIE